MDVCNNRTPTTQWHEASSEGPSHHIEVSVIILKYVPLALLLHVLLAHIVVLIVQHHLTENAALVHYAQTFLI